LPRARLISTDAIALKRMDYGEADRIITIMTPDRGKIRVLARGVRRSTSRMAGHLELFSDAHLMLARGRELDTVTQASTVEPFRHLREDMTCVSYAYHIGELVDSLLQDHDPHAEVFRLLLEALAALDSAVEAPDLIARHFELHLLDLVGFRPELGECLGCSAEIRPEPNGYSVARGGVFCPACTVQEPSAVPIDVDTLKLLRYLQRTRRAQHVTVRSVGGAARDAERILRRHLEHVLERRLRAAEFVRIVAETTAAYSA
jgi:DNA repair protein RecO (recombination protein O)